MAGSNRLLCWIRLPVLSTAAGSLFYLRCWFAMYLMHSVASYAVWPWAISQSISRAASVAVKLHSSILLHLLPG